MNGPGQDLRYGPAMDIRQVLRDLPGYLLRGALITVPLVLTSYIFY